VKHSLFAHSLISANEEGGTLHLLSHEFPAKGFSYNASPAAGKVQIPQDGTRLFPRQAGAGAAVNALGPRPTAGQVGQMAASGHVGQFPAVGQVGQAAAARQAALLPAVRQVGQIAATG